MIEEMSCGGLIEEGDEIRKERKKLKRMIDWSEEWNEASGSSWDVVRALQIVVVKEILRREKVTKTRIHMNELNQ